MVQQSAGNSFISGAGSESFFALVSGDLYQEGVAGANNASIYGFASGSDSISLFNPAGGAYSLLGNTSVAPNPGQVAFRNGDGQAVVSFGDGTSWTLFGTQLQAGDFH